MATAAAEDNTGPEDPESGLSTSEAAGGGKRGTGLTTAVGTSPPAVAPTGVELVSGEAARTVESESSAISSEKRNGSGAAVSASEGRGVGRSIAEAAGEFTTGGAPEGDPAAGRAA